MWCSSILARTTLAAVVTAISVGYANAQQFQAVFSGLSEIPPNLSQGRGTLKMTLNTQGVSAGDFSALATVLTSQATYANIHNINFPTGEIRGEIIQCPSNGCP